MDIEFTVLNNITLTQKTGECHSAVYLRGLAVDYQKNIKKIKKKSIHSLGEGFVTLNL